MRTGQLSGESAFHTRFTDRMKKMKLPTLRKSRATLTVAPPPAVEEDPAPVQVSSVSASSASSGMESGSTSLTIPTIDSSASISSPSPSPSRPSQVRPRPESYASRRLSGISGGTNSSSNLPAPSPLAPRVLSIQDNQWVHQNLLLVFGQVGAAESHSNGHVTVHHHLDGYPPTKWPLCRGYFKALVRLDPGLNKLRFEYNARTSSHSSVLTINMLPLSASQPLQLAVVLACDSSGQYYSPVEESAQGSIDTAVKRFRMAAHLAQAFTGEQMYRNRLGRRCFRLEEEWTNDTLTDRANDTMRSITKVHVIRAEETVEVIRELEVQQNGAALRDIVSKAVDAYFSSFPAPRRHVAALVLDARGSLQLPGITGISALDGGLGIIGSHSLYTIPSCVEEVVPSLTGIPRAGSGVNRRSLENITPWEDATATLGTFLEAFLSPQPPMKPRDFSRIYRTFVAKEPYSSKTRSEGVGPSLPNEENVWPRIDCLRFRYHPCFRLPTDPIPAALPDAPQLYALENGIVVGASTGITLVVIWAEGVYQGYIEYTTRPEREVFLNDELVRSKVLEMSRTSKITLKIFSAGQGETTVEDYAAAKNAKIQLPNGFGSAFKSSSGMAEGGGADSQELVLHSLTTGRMLTGIRVFHGDSSLKGLEFLYEDSSSQLFGQKRSGREPEKSGISDFALDARKGEMLIGFCIRRFKGIVSGIEILTSFGRKSGLYGNPLSGSSSTLIPPRGRAIAGVAGTCASSVDNFAILYK